MRWRIALTYIRASYSAPIVRDGKLMAAFPRSAENGAHLCAEFGRLPLGSHTSTWILFALTML